MERIYWYLLLLISFLFLHGTAPTVTVFSLPLTVCLKWLNVKDLFHISSPINSVLPSFSVSGSGFMLL